MTKTIFLSATTWKRVLGVGAIAGFFFSSTSPMKADVDPKALVMQL